MKRLWLKLFVISFIWGQGTQYERSGDPSELQLPGGYIGISFEFDTKKKIKGYQVSIGFAVPSIGNPGQGPYLFPGIALGNRYLSKENKSYTYIDAQVVLSAGIWGGVGYGIAFVDGQKQLRRKLFGGFLVGGFVNENIKTPELGWQNNSFKAYHLGLGLPLIGYHFHP